MAAVAACGCCWLLSLRVAVVATVALCGHCVCCGCLWLLLLWLPVNAMAAASCCGWLLRLAAAVVAAAGCGWLLC